MRKILIVLAIAVGIGLAAMMHHFGGAVTVDVARGVGGGLILGLNIWPSAPADVQFRVALTECNAQGQCGRVSTNFVNE
jgi:hypothetical protein